MDSTSDKFPSHPSRLVRQVTEQDSWHHELYLRGVDKFCTCRRKCSYMLNRSEGCEFGGDAGQQYIYFCNTQSLGMA